MSGLEHAIGPMGWGDGTLTEAEMIRIENETYERAAADMPVAYRSRPTNNDILPGIRRRWVEALARKGMADNSMCLNTLEEITVGRKFNWLPQDIGSCVASNTFRVWVQRAIAQIAARGDAEEYLGRAEFGVDSIAPYAPQSYGMARKRANMRGSDGLYCEPMAESLMKDGVLDCSTPKLLEILKSQGADGERMLPEPIGKPSLYRAFGNWQFIEELRQFCDHRLLASVKIESVDQHLESSKQMKTAFMCSMIAIRKVGDHPDGFPIHARDPNNRWAHNMGWSGHFYDRSGKLFFILNNTSWGGKAMYNIPAEELERWYKAKLPTVMTLEEIDLPDSPPLIVIE